MKIKSADHLLDGAAEHICNTSLQIDINPAENFRVDVFARHNSETIIPILIASAGQTEMQMTLLVLIKLCLNWSSSNYWNPKSPNILKVKAYYRFSWAEKKGKIR